MLEISTRIGCSLNCRFCPQQRLVTRYSQDSSRPVVMSFDVFKACVDKLPPDEVIAFSGMAEPWLNPACSRMLSYVHEKGHALEAFTTLVGMTMDDYRVLKSVAPRKVCLHIPDAEGNARFSFDETYRTILDQALDDVLSGELSVQSFSCHGTIHPSIRERVLRTGIEVISEMHDRAGNLRAEDIAAESAFRHRDQKLTGTIVCSRCQGDGLFNNVLLPDGTVVLCCMDYGLDHPLGNLLYQSWEEIAEGSVKRHLRLSLAAPYHGDIICRSCISAKPRWQWRLYQHRWIRQLWNWVNLSAKASPPI